jgi:hypothetical protein
VTGRVLAFRLAAFAVLVTSMLVSFHFSNRVVDEAKNNIPLDKRESL